MTKRSSDIYEAVERLRSRIVSRRFDDWWAENAPRLELISAAWVSSSAPLHEVAGALASSPTAAVVSARSEGRRGGIIECEVGDLPAEFHALRDSPIGEVVAVGEGNKDLGIVFDRGPVHLDSTTLPWIKRRIFDEWVTELRAKQQSIDVRDVMRVPVSPRG